MARSGLSSGSNGHSTGCDRRQQPEKIELPWVIVWLTEAECDVITGARH